MYGQNAKSLMRNSFASDHTILRLHGGGWVLEENRKVAVHHVLHEICPNYLPQRLTFDQALSYYDLTKAFACFMGHAIELLEATQLVDNLKPRSTKDREIVESANKNADQKIEKKTTKSEKDKTTNNKKTTLCRNL